MIKLVFCETSERNTQQLEELLTRQARDKDISVRGFKHVAPFLTYIDHYGDSTDLVIVNISLDGISGIKVMKMIQERLPELQIIFVSEFPEMVFDTYAVRHISFLPYPIVENHLDAAIDLACRYARITKKKYLTLQSKGLISRIDIDAIMYLESDLRNILIHTTDAVRKFPGKLDDIKYMLDNSFVQCHKSFIINMAYAIELGTEGMLLYNGECVPVSSRKFKEAREIFLNYTDEKYFDKENLLESVYTIIN